MGGRSPTSRERGPASALRWPWHNRKRASDMDGRGRVRPGGHFVSGDPQSEPDTQESPPNTGIAGFLKEDHQDALVEHPELSAVRLFEEVRAADGARWTSWKLRLSWAGGTH